MKIWIVTLSLLNNYGGILQNFALQKVIRNMGYIPITIDYIAPRSFFLFLYLKSMLKTIIFRILGKKRPFPQREYTYRLSHIDSFVNRQITKTQIVHKYRKYRGSECVLVGSDQVWRPIYNYHTIKDRFLGFCANQGVKRIAYSASFGVDNWEYTPKQTRECSKLAKKFDAISVREESGVKLCKDHLGVDATWVLDPTLLLTKEDYLPICEEVPICNEKYLAVYVLDENEKVAATYEKEASARNLVVKKFHADSKSTLTVPEWLAMFRDASYVVTDSFHGTVFSIIFGKEFKCIYNKDRGAARFESLLKLYNSGKLEEMREFSLNWLKKALEQPSK